jgi:hypothetical protein
MARISVAKIRGDIEKKAPVLASFTKQSWTSRIGQLPRRPVRTLIIGALIAQVLITYCKLFYEPPLLQAAPYNVTETVGLVTRYYELLVEMRYLATDSIAYPPHVGNKAINVTLARNMGLDERVIETMEQLPYLNHNTGGWMEDRDIIFRDGRFVDYRKDRDIYMSRDPIAHWPVYNEKHTKKTFEEDMMDWEDLYPKSALPLTMVRGGMYAIGDAIILDTATNRIHVISTQGDGNRDPFFKDGFGRNEKIPKEYKIKTDFYGPRISYARVSGDFLMDMLLKTAALEDEFLPGSPYLPTGYADELCPPKWYSWVRDLYYKHGWPSPSETREHLLPRNGTYHNPLAYFRTAPFKKEMRELKHNINVRYMPDWVTPVPRQEEYIKWMEQNGDISEEQAAYARGTEEVIPLVLPEFEKHWGRLKISKHWELYGKGNWGELWRNID